MIPPPERPRTPDDTTTCCRRQCGKSDTLTRVASVSPEPVLGGNAVQTRRTFPTRSPMPRPDRRESDGASPRPVWHGANLQTLVYDAIDCYDEAMQISALTRTRGAASTAARMPGMGRITLRGTLPHGICIPAGGAIPKMAQRNITMSEERM
jgi:hypothetical protein